MGFGGFDFIFVLFMFFSGGAGTHGGDFLDMIPTPSYWQAQHVAVTPDQLKQDAGPDAPVGDIDKLVLNLSSDDFKTRKDARKQLEAMGPAITSKLKPALESKDAEVAAVAHELVTRFAERGNARAVRRLMAIRTLGEMKEPSALPLLKDLESSTELFVADYASRAEAAISGHPYVRPDRTAAVTGDLQLLPKDTGIAGQTTGLGAPILPLDKLIDRTIDQMQGNPMQGPGGAQKPDREKILRRMTTEVLKVAERVGNIRVDGVTVGVAENVGPNMGWGIVSVRGEYDRQALVAAVKAEAAKNPSPNNTFKLTKMGDVDVAKIEESMTICAPSNQQLVIVLTSNTVDRDAMVKATLQAIKTGKGTIGDNADMMTLIKSVDQTGPAWMAMKVNAVMKVEKTFEPFDTITLSTGRGKALTSFNFQATGKDPEKVKAAVEEMNNDVLTTLNQIKPQLAQMKSLQPMVDMLASLKVAQVPTGATMTGELKDSIMDSFLGQAGPFFLMSMQEDEQGNNGTTP